jgi:anti-sigma factor RsiW
MPGLLAHRRLRRAVEAYLDGELTPDAHAEVARHLSICWECSIAAETLCLLKRALSQRNERPRGAVLRGW